MYIEVTENLRIPLEEVSFSAIRAQGAGGQHVNKVSTAIHLRFDINASSLAEEQKHRIRGFSDSRISSDGIIVIKAQRYRSQDANKEDACVRLGELLRSALHQHAKRKATKPTRSAKRKRVDSKVKRGKTKAMRSRVKDY